MTPEEFIKQYSYYAVVTSTGGIFPSVKLAQAALESGWGTSQLSTLYKNFFGIKANSSWTGGVADMSTLEYYGSQTPSRIIDGFRVYGRDPFESFHDHTQFLNENPRYSAALQAENAISQAVQLQAAGYATDPNYASKITKIITEYNLFELDKKKKSMKTIEVSIAVLSVILAGLVLYRTFKTL
jgi:flagellum-specific peptidoglycan hydrolase FlgJ